MQSSAITKTPLASDRPVLQPIAVHISFEVLLATVETLTKQQKWQLYQTLSSELIPHSAEAKAIARLQDENDPSQWITAIEGEEINERELNKWLTDRGYKKAGV
jgi:hypothetical protein